MNKKEILIVTSIIVFLICLIIMGGLLNKINKYEDEISKINNEYIKIVAENDNLKNDIDDLNQNVYNLFEKKPYKLNIKHNDTRITYQQDKFGLFDSYIKNTIH